MLQKIRRVITGHNSEGQSFIASDETSPHTLVLLDNPALGLTNLWITDTTPADNSSDNDSADRPVVLEPPDGGSVFRVVEFPPEKQLAQLMQKPDVRKALFAAMSATDAMHDKGAKHPMMHKTSTLDYAIVLSGEIYAVMDEGETLLRAGDCLIQRGTNHAWSNRSDQLCLVAFVLIPAKPLPEQNI